MTMADVYKVHIYSNLNRLAMRWSLCVKHHHVKTNQRTNERSIRFIYMIVNSRFLDLKFLLIHLVFRKWLWILSTLCITSPLVAACGRNVHEVDVKKCLCTDIKSSLNSAELLYAMQIANYNINVTFICKRLYLHLAAIHHARCKLTKLPDLRQRIPPEFQPLFQVDLEIKEEKKQTNRIITSMIIYLYTQNSCEHTIYICMDK